MVEDTNEPFYLNSFCFGFRLFDRSLLIPDFSKHLFRSRNMRNQISKTANGVTRFNVSKKKMSKIKIPLPPLPIQEEIVRILDRFTELETELETELDLRKKQYEYYREQLLSFEDGKVEWKTLGEVDFFEVASGGTPSKSKPEYWVGGNIPWLKSESCNNESVFSASNFITELGLQKSSAKLLQKETTLIALVGATIFKTAFLEFQATTNQNIASIKSKCPETVNDKFIFYYITNLYEVLKSEMRNYGMLNLTTLRQFKIPLPPLSEQERIVNILDRFDRLTNDISVGLPAEIAARHKQYEYYRDTLLSFKEKVS
jgi:type I restriction enzyme S subunit